MPCFGHIGARDSFLARNDPIRGDAAAGGVRAGAELSDVRSDAARSGRVDVCARSADRFLWDVLRVSGVVGVRNGADRNVSGVGQFFADCYAVRHYLAD